MSGAITGTAAQTFQSGDTINNANNINITNTAASEVAATINTATALNIANAGANALINAALFTGVGAINLSGGTANGLSVSEGEIGTTYGISNNINTGISNTATIRTTDLTGLSSTIKFAVNGAGRTAAAPSGNTNNTATLAIGNTTGIEAINLNFAGTANNIIMTGTATATTDLASFVATGAGTGQINVNALTNVETFDLSATTGANTLQFDSSLQSSTTILGGTGATTLRVLQSGNTSSNITATSVETLRLSTNAASNGTINFKTAPSSLATIRVDGDTAEAAVAVTLNKIGAPATINYVGNGLTADVGSTQEFRTVTIINSYTGSDDTVTLNVGNQGQTLGSGIGFKIEGTTTLDGVENLNINVNDIGAAGRFSFDTGLTGEDLSNITVVSAGDVRLGTINARGDTGTAAGGTLSSIDLSDVSGSTQSTLTIADDSISSSTVVIAAVNGTDLTIAGNETTTDTLEFIGSNAADKVSVGTGANEFTGILIATGGAGNDEFTGGTNADSIDGGDGNDIFNASSGNDTVTGGAGNDTFNFNATLIEANDATTATYNGGTGSNNITMTNATTGLVDADLRGFSNIQTFNSFAGATTVSFGTNAASAGITTINGAADANFILNMTKSFAERTGLTISMGLDDADTKRLAISDSGSVDLTNATITRVDSIVMAADAGADAVVFNQGIFGNGTAAFSASITLTNAVDTDNDTIQINKGAVAWDAAAETAASDVNVAGEYFLTTNAGDSVLTYFDQGTSAVVTLTIVGLDAGAISVTSGGNLLFTA